MKRIKTIASADPQFNPYQFKRDDCIGEVHLATCLSCKKYRNCKRRIKIRNILFDALDRIEKETDVKSISQVCIYNIFKPRCEVVNDGK